MSPLPKQAEDRIYKGEDNKQREMVRRTEKKKKKKRKGNHTTARPKPMPSPTAQPDAADIFTVSDESYIGFDPADPKLLQMYMPEKDDIFYDMKWTRTGEGPPSFFVGDFVGDLHFERLLAGLNQSPQYKAKLEAALSQFREELKRDHPDKITVMGHTGYYVYSCTKSDVLRIVRSVHPNLNAEQVFGTGELEARQRIAACILVDGSCIRDSDICAPAPSDRDGKVWIQRSAVSHYQETGKLPGTIVLSNVQDLSEMENLTREQMLSTEFCFEGSNAQDTTVTTMDKYWERQQQQQSSAEQTEYSALNMEAQPLLPSSEPLSDEELARFLQESMWLTD